MLKQGEKLMQVTLTPQTVLNTLKEELRKQERDDDIPLGFGKFIMDRIGKDGDTMEKSDLISQVMEQYDSGTF